MLLHETYKSTLAKAPDKTAIWIDKDMCTYMEFDNQVNQFSSALIGQGVRKNDIVATLMLNRLEMLYMYYAVFKTGAILVPLNYRLQRDELIYAMRHSGTKMLFAGIEFYPRIKGITDEVDSLEKIYIMDNNENHEELPWNKALEEAPNAVEWPDVQEHDPAVILYTSGSTGKPKGVTHTHYSLCHTALNKAITYELGERTIQQIGTQACHTSAFTMVLETLYSGGTAILMREFEPGEFLVLFQRHHPTISSTLPTQLREILTHPLIEQCDFSTLGCMRVGGDKVPHALYDLFFERTGIELTECGGMTECEGYFTNPPYGKRKRYTLGLPIHGTRIRLVDSEFNDVAPGETGEILIKSEAVMQGYWDDPDNTSKAFVDGWLRTGDLARRDQDGYYHFAGRIKQTIIRGGSNITPDEVEEVIAQHPQVSCCGVVGAPDEKYGQIVHAFVVLDKSPEQEPPTEHDLLGFAKEKLAAYKTPERWTFIDQIPLNAMGKVDRKELARMAEEIARQG